MLEEPPNLPSVKMEPDPKELKAETPAAALVDELRLLLLGAVEKEGAELE